jgi:hypothetical protein
VEREVVGKETGGAECVGLRGPERKPRHAWGSGVLPSCWIFLFFIILLCLFSLEFSFFKKITCQRTGRGTTEGEPRHTLVTSRGARGKFGVGGKWQREGWAWVFCLSFFLLLFLHMFDFIFLLRAKHTRTQGETIAS